MKIKPQKQYIEMKKYKNIALSLLLGFSLTGCSDFLEFDPYGLEGRPVSGKQKKMWKRH